MRTSPENSKYLPCWRTDHLKKCVAETKKRPVAKRAYELHQCFQRKGLFAQQKKDVSELIILAVSSSYSGRSVVWCAVAKEAEKMRNTLEDLYYGNITPGVQQTAPNSELKRATDLVTRFESQLTERLDEDGQSILAKLIESRDEVESITARENFVLGFRLGARITMECMDGNDGDIREVTDHG